MVSAVRFCPSAPPFSFISFGLRASSAHPLTFQISPCDNRVTILLGLVWPYRGNGRNHHGAERVAAGLGCDRPQPEALHERPQPFVLHLVRRGPAARRLQAIRVRQSHPPVHRPEASRLRAGNDQACRTGRADQTRDGCTTGGDSMRRSRWPTTSSMSAPRTSTPRGSLP